MASGVPLLLCPRGSCLQPSNIPPGTLGSFASFFVCRDEETGTSQGATTWLPASGQGALSAFLNAGFHTNPCSAAGAECDVCSWIVPNGLPTRALADRCRACAMG